MKKLNVSLLSVTLAMAAALASPLQAQDACATINCDCAAIENAAWTMACSASEKQLKEKCKVSKGQQSGYCSLHGPAAKPLPLALKTPTVDLAKNLDSDNESRKIASMYWSIREDFNFALKNVKDKKLGDARKILSISDNNVDNLYLAQLRNIAYLNSQGEDGAARKLWKNYAEDSAALASYWHQEVLLLSKQLSEAKDPAARAELTAFVVDALTVNGKQYELAATEYGNSGRDGKAADYWKSASQVASLILRILSADNSSGQALVSHYQSLAAARLNRASYHALHDEDEEDAEDLLRASQEFVANQQLLDEILKNREDLQEQSAEASARRPPKIP